jgi:hypothetical protein
MASKDGNDLIVPPVAPPAPVIPHDRKVKKVQVDETPVWTAAKPKPTL